MERVKFYRALHSVQEKKFRWTAVDRLDGCPTRMRRGATPKSAVLWVLRKSLHDVM
jgi:hypothetical protein